MTNHSYEVTRNDSRGYLLRIPGEGTKEMINRLDERKSTELACKLAIDSELLYFSNYGCKVMKFIRNPKAMDAQMMKRDDIIKQAAGIFRKLHSCGVDTQVRFEVFEMAAMYENIIRENHVPLYVDYSDIKNRVMIIKNEMEDKFGIEKVPCHNDSLLGNWALDTEDNLWLIDWEYSTIQCGICHVHLLNVTTQIVKMTNYCPAIMKEIIQRMKKDVLLHPSFMPIIYGHCGD